MRRILPVLLSLALGACASTPQRLQRDGGAAWQQHRAAVESITAFALQARAAGGGMGVKADLSWRQHADGRFDIRLSGPLGAGAFAISGTPRAVEIRSKDGVETTPDPQAWLLARAGWSFPVQGLRWWTLGLPAPGAAARMRFDAQGRLAELQQDGWTLHYLEYQDAGPFSLPRRFAAENAEISLKLVIDRWDDLPAR